MSFCGGVTATTKEGMAAKKKRRDSSGLHSRQGKKCRCVMNTHSSHMDLTFRATTTWQSKLVVRPS